MGSDKEVATIPKMFRTYYDTKANLDAFTGLRDGELGWGTDTFILYRQDGNGVANWVSITDPSAGGGGHINIRPWDYVSIGQGTWAITLNASRYNYCDWWNGTAEADGDNISYKVYLAKGTYTLRLLVITGGDYGITDVYIDADEVASHDCYGGSVVNVVKDQANIVVATSGLKTLKFILDGKNGSSSSYNFAVISICLFRTA